MLSGMPERPEPLPMHTVATRPVDRTTDGQDAGLTSLGPEQLSAVAATIASQTSDAIMEETIATEHTLPSASSRDSLPRGASSMLSGDLRGSLIGRFMVLRKLGEGGMGQVYAAYDTELDRKVAIKLLSANYQSSTAIARLTREAQGLARLSHPNVVTVYEVGQHQGAVFIAMEYIDGQTLRDHFASAPDRTWRDKLATLVQAGHGLAAAHDKQLVHRDFKPDNVMVATDGRVRVLDFGLVRGLESEHADDVPSDGDDSRGEGRPRSPADRHLTRTGAIMGTPAYMALEQLEGKGADALTDQFSFCVVLFEALYGQRPFEGDTGAAVAARMYAGEIRPRPSKSEVPRRVHDAIVRGLAAKPSDRWPNMLSLLAELESNLGQRKRRGYWAAVGALGALVGLVVIATPLVRDAISDRDQRIAEQQQDLEARAAELEANAAELAQSNVDLRRQFDIQTGLTAKLLADSPGRSVEALTMAIDVYGRYYLRGEVLPLPIESGLFAATRRIHNARELLGHTEKVVAIEFSPDGTRFATASRDDTVKLWDPITGELVRTLAGHVDDLRSVEFSPDSARVLTTSADATATLWMAETGKVLVTIDDYDVAVARFSPDGRSLAIGAEDGSLSLWSSAPGEEIVEQQVRSIGARIDALAFSPDSTRLAAATNAGLMHLWAGATELARVEVGKVDARTLRFSPDGTRLAAAGVDGAIVLRDGQSGKAIATLPASHGEVRALAFAPVGPPRLLSTGLEGSPKLWRTDTGELVAIIDGHREAATDVAFAPDGRTFATVSFDARVRLGNTATGQIFELLEGQLGSLDRVGFSPDGERLVSLGNDRVVRLWSATRTNETLLVRGRGRELGAIAFSPDRTRVLAGERGGYASVWAANEPSAAAQPLFDLDHAGKTVYAVAFSPDGKRLATGDTAGFTRIWNAQDGALQHQLGPHAADVKALEFSPDARLLASCDLEGQLRLWDVASGALVREWAAAGEGVTALAFAPDGASVATIDLLGPVSTWNVQTGAREHLLGSEGLSFALAYSPDGRQLAVAGGRKQVDIWDVANETRVAVLVGEDPMIDGVAFSPDGGRVITGGDAWVRLWDVGTGLHLADFAMHDAKLLAVGFSPDGAQVYSGSADGQVRVSVANANTRLSLACRALRGNRGYGVVAPTCTAVLE
jgi:WD40 repeat protein/serine/threonine protein kinase